MATVRIVFRVSLVSGRLVCRACGFPYLVVSLRTAFHFLRLGGFCLQPFQALLGSGGVCGLSDTR